MIFFVFSAFKHYYIVRQDNNYIDVSIILLDLKLNQEDTLQIGHNFLSLFLLFQLCLLIATKNEVID